MKLNSHLAASLFAIAAAFSLNVSAASDQPSDNTAGKVDATGKATPCSCMEEKVGTTSDDKQAIPEKITPAKVNPFFDKTRHFHPRDGGKF